MTDRELMERLRSEFKKMTEKYALDTDEVTISAKGPDVKIIGGCFKTRG